MSDLKGLRDQSRRDRIARLKSYGAGKAESRSDMAGSVSIHGGIKHRAAGGAIEGAPSRPRMDRGGRKGGKGKKGATTVNVVIASKPDDKPPMPMPIPMPMPAGGPPPMMPPKPPMAPPLPPAAAGGPPPGAPPGGPPIPMRAAGGRLKKRAEGGEVVEEEGWTEARARIPKIAPRVSAPRAPTPAPAPRPSSPSSSGSPAGAIGEVEAVINGTPGSPIGTVRRGVLDALSLPSRLKQRRDEKAKEDAAKQRASGGRLGMTAGAASGEGRLEKEAIQKRKD